MLASMLPKAWFPHKISSLTFGLSLSSPAADKQLQATHSILTLFGFQIIVSVVKLAMELGLTTRDAILMRKKCIVGHLS